MTDGVTGRELVVDRADVADVTVRDRTFEPGDGEVLVAVDRVAVTSNNVTYAVVGDALHYWDAYPTGSDDTGIVPVWGFADVLASAHDDVDAGERLYGFWPMATHAVLRPDRVGPLGFRDVSPHRSELAGTYQRYERAAADPLHDERTAHLEPLYRPLFGTAFLLDDLVTDEDTIGAPVTSVVVTSASSKTSTALLHLLARRDDVQVVGVTSSRSIQHVRDDGLCDLVVGYDQLGRLDEIAASASVALVDVAGRASVRDEIHDVLGDSLVASLGVGMTHHDAPDAGLSFEQADGDRGDGGSGRQRVRTTMFFAPARAAARVRDWGPAGFAERLGSAWQPFAAWVDGRVDVRIVDGLDALVDEWRAVVAGDVDPGEGLLVAPAGVG